MTYNPEATKYCPACRKFKKYDDFYKHKARYDGLQNKCKECQTRYNKRKKDALAKTRQKTRKKADPFIGTKGTRGKKLIQEYLDGDDNPSSKEHRCVLEDYLKGDA